MNSKGLDELRQAIGEVDASIVALLSRRAAISMAVGALKNRQGGEFSEVFRPGREADLFRALEKLNHGPLPAHHLRAIYREIFSSSRQLQRPQRVAFLGPEGTFSHIAGRELIGSLASFHPQPSLEGVFSSVADGDCDSGIVPLENTLQGSIGQSLDLFMRYPGVFIRAETNCRIRHSLLSSERDLASVQRVYSHAQPLGQCADWLRANLPRATLLPLESTAAAARHVLHEKGAAAIAHISIAHGLGLHVLAKDIENARENRTRFAVIGLTPADRPGPDKSSLLFAVADGPGKLHAVLQIFSDNGLNMLKLESRPMPGEAGKYVFFADLECDVLSPENAAALTAMRECCLFFRVLGSYPAQK